MLRHKMQLKSDHNRTNKHKQLIQTSKSVVEWIERCY